MAMLDRFANGMLQLVGNARGGTLMETIEHLVDQITSGASRIEGEIKLGDTTYKAKCYRITSTFIRLDLHSMEVPMKG